MLSVSDMNPFLPSRARTALLTALLAGATLAVFCRTLTHEFVDWDDPAYVTKNDDVRNGLSPAGVRHAFTDLRTGNWHPLTMLSHMLDVQLFGMKPAGHHLTNVLLHTANTLLLFWLLKRMTGAELPSALVAALFALHPLHVESVAWVSERKDLLSTLFGFLTMLAYLRYVEHRSLGRYLLTLGMFTLGLMSKPMLVTLPFVLLLLDYWPLGRFTAGSVLEPRRVLRATTEKIPFFALAFALSVITFFAQRGAKTVQSLETFPLDIRLANAAVAYVGYLVKMFWPRALAALYPHPGNTLPLWQVIGASLALLAISVTVLGMRRRHPCLLVGWLWYLGTLVPVIGIVQVGPQAMADRYTYVPLVGVFLMLSWGGAAALKKYDWPDKTVTTLCIVTLAALAVCSTRQLRHWRDSIALFRHATEVTSQNVWAHTNLSVALARAGRPYEAVVHARHAVRIEPRSAGLWVNLGGILFQQGRLSDAVAACSHALRLKPDSDDAHANLARALVRQGKLAEAAAHYSAALTIQPDAAVYHNNLGEVLATLGDNQNAGRHFEQALQLQPDYSRARRSLQRLQREGATHKPVAHPEP